MDPHVNRTSSANGRYLLPHREVGVLNEEEQRTASQAPVEEHWLRSLRGGPATIRIRGAAQKPALVVWKDTLTGCHWLPLAGQGPAGWDDGRVTHGSLCSRPQETALAAQHQQTPLS